MSSMISSEELAHNLDEVRQRVARAALRAGRSPDDITILAISKTFDLTHVRRAFEIGQLEFGENRVQEAKNKIEAWNDRWPADRPQWHLVGHLQSNKARDAVRLFDLIHSVDSIRLAEMINRWARSEGKIADVMIEVNVACDPAKYGISPEELPGLVAGIQALDGVRICGLMTIGSLVSEPERARLVFRDLRKLRDQMASSYPEVTWEHLSMGMTGDYEVAIEEGATIVRIGRAIFGERRDT